MQKANNGIELYYNHVPDQLCDKIIKFFEKDIKTPYVKKSYAYNGEGVSSTDEDAIVKAQCWNRFIPEIDSELYDLYSQAVIDYSSKYRLVASLSDTPYKYKKYEVGGYFDWHTDTGLIGNTNVIQGMMYLNDDYEGGEVEWEHWGLIKPSKGLCIIAPSGFLFRHRCREITRGDKYIITTFLTYKED